MLPFERKASPSCMGRATVVNGRISCFCLPLKDRKGQWRRLSALTRIAFELNQTQDRP